MLLLALCGRRGHGRLLSLLVSRLAHDLHQAQVRLMRAAPPPMQRLEVGHGRPCLASHRQGERRLDLLLDVRERAGPHVLDHHLGTKVGADQ